MKEDYFPLIFTTLGREEWLKKHPITITLPETEVVASKPLTEFELRDKRNAVRLGLIEDSDDAYRLWKNKVHKANLRDKTIGTIGAGTAMGLASIFTMANPASLYAYGAMGVSNFPNLVDKIKYDIDTGLYAGAAADVGLTAMELLPAALVTSPIWMPAVKGAVRLGDRLYKKASPYYDLYRTILETDPAEALLKLLFFNLTKAPKLSNITLEKDFEAAMNDPTYRFGNLRHLTNLDNGYKTPSTKKLSVISYEPAPAQTYVTLSDFPLQLVNGKLVKSDKAFFGTNIGLMPNRPYYDVNVPKKSRITYVIDADKVPETELYTGLNNFTYPTVGYLPSLHTTMVKYDPVLKLFVPSRFVMPPKSLTAPSSTISFGEVPNRSVVLKPIVNNLTRHLQGDDAVKMFKEYGGEAWPEGSINGKELMKYVSEARERYGLVGRTDITDEEIALALYKHSKELGGNTAAVNALGEPLLLFRGDTKDYTELKSRMTPEELATKKGTMDNSLGTLFLGEFPNSYLGADRYVGTWRQFNGNISLVPSGTGSKVLSSINPENLPKGSYELYSGLFGKRLVPIRVIKLPGSAMESGTNNLNAFIVRTPNVRNATSEISVLNDDWLVQGAYGATPHMKTKYIEDEDGFPLFLHPDGTTTPALAGYDNRPGMAEHYRYVLNDAEANNQGLLRSDIGAPLREEHSLYTYFALPNFNIKGTKHILPFDLRIPRDWTNSNIYKIELPILGLGTAGTSLYNKSKQLQTYKQGGEIKRRIKL